MVHDNEVPQEIVGAAKEYFLKFGYSRVSTGEIAKSIGRSKKTLYNHFETKEALLGAVLQRVNDDAEHDLTELLASDCPLDIDERLRQVLSKVAVHLASTGQVLFDDLREKAQDLYKQSQHERYQALTAILRPLFQEGVKNGFMRGDLQINKVLLVFFAGVEAVAGPAEIAANPRQYNELFKTLVTLVVDGMRA